jgi:hypothetical protein
VASGVRQSRTSGHPGSAGSGIGPRLATVLNSLCMLWNPIYINDRVYWANVPLDVWTMTIGG